MMSMIWMFYFIEIVISTSCGPDGSSSRYNETIIGAQRIILSSGCPNHHDTCVGRPGVCTNRRSGISLGVTLSNATNKEVSIPAYPCINSASGDGVDMTCTGGEIGIMLNGVSLFSQTAGGVECPDAVVAEAATFNMCGGHATPYGQYHYHLAPGCLLHQLRDYGTLNPYNRHSPLIGWAYDGFPIYGPHGNDGTYIYKCNHPNANLLDCLDSCNGHRQHTIDGFKYHYHVTGPVGNLSGDIAVAQLWPYPDASMSPYTIGCFRGIVTNKWKSQFRQLTCVESGTVDGYQAKTINGVSHLIYPEQIPLSAVITPVTSPVEFVTKDPTLSPTKEPTHTPTQKPSDSPTIYSTSSPTMNPTESPSILPTTQPTEYPTLYPTDDALFSTFFSTISNTESIINDESESFHISNPLTMALVVGGSTLGLIICAMIIVFVYKIYKANSEIADVEDQKSDILTPLSHSPIKCDNMDDADIVDKFPNTLQTPATPITPISPNNHTCEYSKASETGVGHVRLQMWDISNSKTNTSGITPFRGITPFNVSNSKDRSIREGALKMFAESNAVDHKFQE